MKLNDRQKFAVRKFVFTHCDIKDIMVTFDEEFDYKDRDNTWEAIHEYITDLYSYALQKEGIQEE